MTTPMTTIQNLLTQALQQLQQKNYVQVSTLVREVFAQDPDNADGFYLLGVSASEMQHHDLAENLLTRAIDIKANQPYYHFNLGVVLSATGKRQEAQHHLLTAIRLKPDLAEAHVNMGNLLFGQGDHRTAVEFYLHAVTLNPNLTTGYYNLGVIFQEYGDQFLAIEQFDQALRCAPNDANSHMGRGASLLKIGDFAQGWPEYEWRFRLPNHMARICPVPRWDGASPEGKIIYLYTEQGFGDALMFARFAPIVRALGAKVYLECRPELTHLLTTSQLADQVVSRDLDDKEPPPFEYDLHLPLMSLPNLLATTLTTLPQQIPYLTPEPQRVAAWAKRLGPRQKLRVGLSWSGNPKASVNRHRACTLADLLPLTLVPEVSFYALQKGPPADQLTEDWQHRHAIIPLNAELTDFTETAAALLNLDLLISTDTAIVHLAGGLGVPVWTLLHTASEWRWLENRPDSPWYPTMRLFRQQKPGGWQAVVNDARVALAELASMTKITDA